MNKKGAALVLVIVIFVALTLMVGVMFVIANVSISSSDSGLKARESYFAARSGVEFIKSELADIIADVETDMQAELDEKEDNPGHDLPTEPIVTYLYAYGDNVVGFTKYPAGTPNPANQSAFKNARIQLELKMTEERSFDVTDGDTGAGNYINNITIEAYSTGKSEKTSAITNVFSSLFEKGVKLPLPQVYSEEYGSILLAYGGSDPGEPDPEEPNPYIIPGTENAPGGGIPTLYTWNDEVDGLTDITDVPEFTYGTTLKTTFYHNGDYYINYQWFNPNLFDPNYSGMPDDYMPVVKIRQEPAQNIDHMISFGWWEKTLEDLNQSLIDRGGYALQRGNIVVYNGIFYVYANVENKTDHINPPPWYDKMWTPIPGQ